jgi:hypothetical protein
MLANLIPSYDMLGSPMPAILAQFLMALTLAAHWAFLSMTAGGAIAYVMGQNSTESTPIRSKLSAFLPYSLSMAMTLGIAPLLFVQVLYGNFFYTANILIGYVWLGLLGLMVVNLYLLFWAWRRSSQGKSIRGLGVLILALLAASAFILATNGTLAQNPQDWETFRANSGTTPYYGDATLIPRWLFALSALLAGGGLFVAFFARLEIPTDSEAMARPVSRPLGVSIVGCIGTLVFGLWGSLALPKSVRTSLFGSLESVFVYAAIVGFAAALVLGYTALKSMSIRRMLFSAIALFVGLFATAALRDTLRRLALAEYFDLSSVPVYSQWSSFMLFAVILVLGLGLVGYVVVLAYGTDWAKRPNASAAQVQGSG